MTPVLPNDAQKCTNAFFDDLKERGLLESDLIARYGDFKHLPFHEVVDFYIIGEAQEAFAFYPQVDGRPRLVYLPEKHVDRMRSVLKKTRKYVYHQLMFNVYLPDTNEVKVVFISVRNGTKMMDLDGFSDVLKQQAMIRYYKSKVDNGGRMYSETDFEIIHRPLKEGQRERVLDRAFNISFTVSELVRQGKQFWEPLVTS